MFKSLIFILILSQTLIGLSQPQEDRGITIGPVIGTVTNSTARVLVEFNFTGNITMVLNETDKGVTFNDTKNFTAGEPVLFRFFNLTNGTYYNVTFDPPIPDQVPSYFKTVNTTTPGLLKFGLVSCDEISVLEVKAPEADLWAHLSNKIDETGLDYLLHIGDQVYLDMGFGDKDLEDGISVNQTKPYPAIMKILNTTAPEEWENKTDELLNIIRDEYRKTWGFPSVKAVLAKIPNIMMFDDHEIRDDWGFIETDWNVSSADYFYGSLARRAYYEYQRQLREDIDVFNLTNITSEYFNVTINDVGFLFVDYRGVRSWFRNETDMAGSQLGIQQKEFINQTLNGTNATFANLTTVFVISSFPVALFGTNALKLGNLFSNDFAEGWTFNHTDELIWFIDQIRGWKNAVPGRDIMVLAGDIHMGGKTNISYDEEYQFRQFTSSSMASLPPPDIAFKGFESIIGVENDFPSDFSDYEYEHYSWTNKYNYGLLAVNVTDGQSHIDAYLVAAGREGEPEELIEDDNPFWSKVLEVFGGGRR